MWYYFRKITHNDTKKQIESTEEAFETFFGGDVSANESSVVFTIDCNGSQGRFKLSKGAGKSNSYRFAGYDKGPSLRGFIESQFRDLEPQKNFKLKAGDFLKFEKTNHKDIYSVEIIKSGSPEYKGIESLSKRKQDIIIEVDEDSDLFNLMQSFDNEEFILSCLEYMRDNSLLSKDRLALLSDKDRVSDEIGISTDKGIIYLVTEFEALQESEKSQIASQFVESFEIGGDKYLVLKNWKEDSKRKFLGWLLSLGIICNKRVVDDYIQEIHFGAPGTGKSYSISSIIQESYDFYTDKVNNPFVFRTTIHNEYSYYDFIGNILPQYENEKISYKFTPGIFTEAIVKAFKYQDNDVFLIIEEMSRGNIAAIFGDIFQLLDRDDNGQSEYRIDNSLIKGELIKAELNQFKLSKVYIPSNLHIIGTVNTSDQNVNVIDTAFKRRFGYVYESVDPKHVNNDEKKPFLNEYEFTLGGKTFSWNDFYKKVNEFILNELELSEDKQLGQFFVKFHPSNNDKNFASLKNKVLHYLWDDVQSVSITEHKLFHPEIKSFSKLYTLFKKNTEASKIFNEKFLDKF